jgi:hypothetical protein
MRIDQQQIKNMLILRSHLLGAFCVACHFDPSSIQTNELLNYLLTLTGTYWIYPRPTDVLWLGSVDCDASELEPVSLSRPSLGQSRVSLPGRLPDP